MAKNNNTLVFNGLMQGMSWDLIKEAKDEIKRHLGEKPPTKKDILTDWIIGKDYMLQLQGNSYQGGGSFNLNPNNLGLYALQNGNNTGTNFNVGNSSTSTSAGGSDFINTASQIGGFIGMFDQLGGNIYLGASQNYAGFSNDPYKKAILGDSSKGMLAGLISRKSELNNALDDINSLVLQFNIGDNASLMSLWNTYIPLKESTGDAELVDIFGTLVAPGMYNLFGSAKENQEAINLAVKSANARNLANFNTAANNNQLLNTFNQLQHMTKNGGHLALEGKLFKNVKNKIADAMQADLNYSDAPSTNRLNTINKLRGYPTFIFGGGNTGGGGASGYWDEVTKVTPETYWVMNTPLPGRSFSEAFAEAVKDNLETFWFNNKLYNTKRASSEEEYLKNRTKAEYEEPLNLRTVYDKDWNIYLDSTRIEPYTGQLPIIEKKKSKGGKLNKSHKFAEGGLLNTYDYGLEEVNAGGSHEENPNEGVVVSYAPDGLPNKVEEGETIHNDYVYSKRLEANEKVLENNLLDKKYEGKSFADISKKLTEDRKKRPNDPISVRTNEENLNRLQDALEELKLDNKTREVKRFLGSLNNDLLNALQLEMMDEYEAYAELLAQQLEQEALAYQEEQAALEGMFGRGGHLKQNGSLISATEPVYDAEGKIVGWKQPETTTENVLNLSGYNPNYEGALIYADDRNWFLRNITSPWNTWWNNLPSQEFSWAVRNLTPVGVVDAIINGDTERLLAAINTGGSVLRNIFNDAEELNLTRRLLQDRAIDKMWKNAPDEGLASSKASSKTTTPKTSTGKPKKSSTPLKLTPQEINTETPDATVGETKKAKFLKRLKNAGITTGISTGVGAAINFGIKENERLKAIKDIYDSEIPILESDSVKVPYSNTNNYIYSPDSSYWYDPVEGRMFYKKSEGGRLFLGGGGFAPYEFEEVNGEIFAHKNINRNGNIVTLTIPEAEFTPDIVTAYGIWKQRNNSNSSNVSTKNTPVKLKSTNTPKPTTTSPNNPNYTGLDYMPDSTPVNVELPLGYILDINPNLFGEFNSNEIVDSNSDFIDYSLRPKANPLNSELNGRTTPPPRSPEYKPNYLSYLRYAPILGSLGLVLSDTLGLTNQPDYSNIDMYRRAVDSIGGVNFVPIGGYLQHTPIDKEYIANQLLALSASYNRSLNNANPVGSYILGLVNDAKVRDQIGDMYINAAAQDLKNKLAVAEYNRGIDITNARNSLMAQSENARLRALRANEYQKIATMRDNERNTAEAARAANYLGLFTNIGNLGTDEMNRTMVNRNPALFYGVNLDGSIYFKNAFWGLSEDTQNELVDMLEKQGYKISK